MGAAAEWQVLLGWTAATLVEPPLRQELQRGTLQAPARRHAGSRRTRCHRRLGKAADQVQLRLQQAAGARLWLALMLRLAPTFWLGSLVQDVLGAGLLRCRLHRAHGHQRAGLDPA